MLGEKYIQRKSTMKKWSIQVDYTTRDDDGKPFRARSTFQCEASDIPSAYELAKASSWGGYEPVKFGVIISGWHVLR